MRAARPRACSYRAWLYGSPDVQRSPVSASTRSSSASRRSSSAKGSLDSSRLSTETIRPPRCPRSAAGRRYARICSARSAPHLTRGVVRLALCLLSLVALPGGAAVVRQREGIDHVPDPVYKRLKLLQRALIRTGGEGLGLGQQVNRRLEVVALDVRRCQGGRLRVETGLQRGQPPTGVRHPRHRVRFRSGRQISSNLPIASRCSGWGWYIPKSGDLYGAPP